MVPLTDPEVDTRTNGQTIDETWFNVLKEVVEDHEGRVQDLEALIRSLDFRVEGFYGDFQTNTILPINQVLIYRLIEDIHLVAGSGQLFIENAGASGTSEIDIQFKRGAGAWTSIFSTKPSAAYTSGNLFTSSNGVIDTAYDDLLAGDYLRLNVTSVQIDGDGMTAKLKYTRTI